MFKIALNLVAATDGMEAALDAKYDEARRYVREPHSRRELWEYVQRTPNANVLVDELEVPPVSFARYRADGHDSVAMWLLAGEFFVDLISPGSVRATVMSASGLGPGRLLFHDRAGTVWDVDGNAVGPVDFRKRLPRQ